MKLRIRIKIKLINNYNIFHVITLTFFIYLPQNWNNYRNKKKNGKQLKSY